MDKRWVWMVWVVWVWVAGGCGEDEVDGDSDGEVGNNGDAVGDEGEWLRSGVDMELDGTGERGIMEESKGSGEDSLKEPVLKPLLLL